MHNEASVYPIGRMAIPEAFSATAIKEGIREIKVLPRMLDYCIENLDAAQLEVPYREGGWSINQIIHHIADSHMNAYVRTKLMLTEENPLIKPYSQNDWALTPDVMNVPANYSITLAHSLHHRWVALLETLNETEMNRTYFHPEYNKTVALWEVIHTYAWHGKHHVAQIRTFRKRMDW